MSLDPVDRFLAGVLVGLAAISSALIVATVLSGCAPDESLFGPFVPSSGMGGGGGTGRGSVGVASSTESAGSSGPGGAAVFWATGIQENVPPMSLSGWKECWAEPFGASDTPVSKILAQCKGGFLAMGCRPKGDPLLSLLAMAPRADVIFDTNPPVNPPLVHQANGIGWYFNEYGWGFAPAGDEVVLGNCDVVDIKGGAPGVDGDLRMCVKFHSLPEWATHPGFRCGKLWEAAAPGFGAAYERVVLSAD